MNKYDYFKKHAFSLIAYPFCIGAFWLHQGTAFAEVTQAYPPPEASASPTPTDSPSPTPEASPSPTPEASPSPTPAPEASEEPKLSPIPAKKTYSIQLGTYTNLKKAVAVKEIIQNVILAQVQRIKTDKNTSLYRVLAGTFATIQKADDFARSHRLKDLFKDVWMDPIAVETPMAEGEILTAEQLEQDPFYLHLDLHCEKGKKYGTYKAELQPSEADPNRNIDVKVEWNCIPLSTERWAARDEERNPSHLFLSPMFGLGSNTNTGSSIGSVNASDFSYGFDFGGFKSFGGMGPTFEYRLLNHRYAAQAPAPAALFVLSHRFLVGARLPISHRFEFQPLFGFFTENFAQGTTLGSLTYASQLLAQAGVRMTWHLFNLDDRSSLNAVGGVHYLFPATTSTLTVQSGLEWTIKLQSEHFNPDGWGADWFMEYTNHSQNASTFQQADTMFMFGVSILCSI